MDKSWILVQQIRLQFLQKAGFSCDNSTVDLDIVEAIEPQEAWNVIRLSTNGEMDITLKEFISFDDSLSISKNFTDIDELFDHGFKGRNLSDNMLADS